MKSFLLGLLLQGVIIGVAMISKSERILINASTILGLGSLGVAMTISGLMSGSIHRRTANESKEERNKRIERTTSLILLGLPSIIVLVVYHALIK